MPSKLPPDEYKALLDKAIPTMKALSHLKIEPLFWNDNNKKDFYCIAGIYVVRCESYTNLHWAKNISGAIDDKLDYLEARSNKINQKLQQYYDNGHKPYFWITSFCATHDEPVLNALKRQEKLRMEEEIKPFIYGDDHP